MKYVGVEFIVEDEFGIVSMFVVDVGSDVNFGVFVVFVRFEVFEFVVEFVVVIGDLEFVGVRVCFGVFEDCI